MNGFSNFDLYLKSKYRHHPKGNNNQNSYIFRTTIRKYANSSWNSHKCHCHWYTDTGFSYICEKVFSVFNLQILVRLKPFYFLWGFLASGITFISFLDTQNKQQTSYKDVLNVAIG